jgi:hypothetical protein
MSQKYLPHFVVGSRGLSPGWRDSPEGVKLATVAISTEPRGMKRPELDACSFQLGPPEWIASVVCQAPPDGHPEQHGHK